MRECAWPVSLLLVLSSCAPEGPSALEGSTGTGTGGTTSTQSGPTTATETTDTDETTTEETESESESETETETGEDEPLPPPPEPELPPPVESDAPCPVLDAGPNEVIGAYARDPFLAPGHLYFVRADGSTLSIDEQSDTYFGALANDERVLVLSQSDCGSQSVARLVERDTGVEIWGELNLPHGFVQTRPGRMQADGRIVLNGSNCEDPNSYFMVIDNGQLLDEGHGVPSPERIRPDGWLPLFRSFEEAESIWLWRNVESMQEHEPVFDRAPDTGRPVFLTSGALVYFSEIEGELTLVVEEPDAAELIDVPELAQLAADGWALRLEWSVSNPVSPYGWDSDWSLVRAFGPQAELRYFALTPELELVEVTPTLPRGQAMLECAVPNLDGLGGMQLPLFDGEYVWLWDQPQPGEWDQLGVRFTQIERAGVLSGGDALYMRGGQYGDCGIEWAEPTEPSLVGGRVQYLRGEGLVVPPAEQAHTADPSWRCVAYATEGGRDKWVVHEIEANTTFAMPDEIGPGWFFWLR